ncbi:hypothetical protein D3C71_1368280 [compost metagenome]
MHLLRIFAFHKERLPAHAFEVSRDLFFRHAGQNGRVADLEAVQMQDRQRSTVRDRVDEPV